VKKLGALTEILRSKNAGPLYITFDLIFADRQTMEYVHERLRKETVAEAYKTDPEQVEIIAYGVVNAIKITFPRRVISGDLTDCDIYGCQQHMALANLEIQ